MKQLQIFRSEPNQSTLFLASALGEGKEVTRWDLFKDTDYDGLVEQIFAHEDIICWW